jgi:hypothetical protein
VAVVSISEAAKLVRRGRASLYRDIEKGRLSKTVSPTGETGIDTSELVRVYGTLHLPEASKPVHETSAAKNLEEFATLSESWDTTGKASRPSHATSGDTEKAVLVEKLRAFEQRVELLERIVALEKTVRQDTTAALKAQLADKETVLKSLENRVLMLTYEKPAREHTKKGFFSWFRRPK